MFGIFLTLIIQFQAVTFNQYVRHVSPIDTPIVLDISGPMYINKQFIANMYIIRTLPKGSTVILSIDSPGGLVFVEESYLDALRSRDIKIIAYVCSNCMAASAAGILALEADRIVFEKSAVFMAHAIRAGDMMLGKETYYKLMACCRNVLTLREIKDITHGAEVWLTGFQVMRRLEHDL